MNSHLNYAINTLYNSKPFYRNDLMRKTNFERNLNKTNESYSEFFLNYNNPAPSKYKKIPIQDEFNSNFKFQNLGNHHLLNTFENNNKTINSNRSKNDQSNNFIFETRNHSGSKKIDTIRFNNEVNNFHNLKNSQSTAKLRCRKTIDYPIIEKRALLNSESNVKVTIFDNMKSIFKVDIPEEENLPVFGRKIKKEVKTNSENLISVKTNEFNHLINFGESNSLAKQFSQSKHIIRENLNNSNINM